MNGNSNSNPLAGFPKKGEVEVEKKNVMWGRKGKRVEVDVEVEWVADLNRLKFFSISSPHSFPIK